MQLLADLQAGSGNTRIGIGDPLRRCVAAVTIIGLSQGRERVSSLDPVVEGRVPCLFDIILPFDGCAEHGPERGGADVTRRLARGTGE